MNVILGFLQNIKLTLSQYLMLALATAVGILAVIVQFKSKQLRLVKLDLLQSHFEATDQKTEMKSKQANDAYDASLRRLNDYLSKNADLHDPSSK
jgi:hypothetical protein